MAQAAPRGRTGDKLVESMARAGFPLARHAPLHERPAGRALYHDNELIFNRALDGKSSAFCALATIEEDGAVALHWYNPDPAGSRFRKEEFLRKVVLPQDAGDEEVGAAVRMFGADAAKKKQNELFMDAHTHFGALCPPHARPDGSIARHGYVNYDDGVSFLTDNIRKALFYHMDYYALTSHNGFSRNMFEMMTWARHRLGLMPVPATELTAPLKEPNGPHILVFMKNAGVADQLARSVLSRREKLDMPSYFSGMSMDDMLGCLYGLQESNLAVLGLAHPVNFNSPRLPIPIVGLYSAVDTGTLTLEQAHGIAGHFDTIAMWNTSLYAGAEEMRIQDPGLKSFLREVNRKHVGNRRLWVNQTNFALAKELHERFGLNTHFETDEHRTLPFVREHDGPGYILGGDSLAMGTTVITAPEGMAKRPTVPELIEQLRTRALSMAGRVFAVARPEAITVHADRAAIPEGLRRMAHAAENAVTRRYAGMLVRDFFDLLFSGDVEDIGNMTGS
jgi:hypothetical protein